MISKIHTTPDGRIILTVCDKELINQKFKEGNRILDLTADFYKGIEMDEEKIIQQISKSYMISLIGKKSVAIGKKMQIINDDVIQLVENVEHADAIIIANDLE